MNDFLDDPIPELRALIDASLPPPSRHVRARIVEAIEGPLRYAPFTGRIAALWDLPIARAAELLESATRNDAWQSGPIDGMQVLPVRPGPRVQSANALFLRGAPSTQFPKHRHLGDEHVLVLEGAYRNDDGSIARRGDYEVMPPDSAHGFQVFADGPCVCAFLLFGGFEIVF